MAQPLGTLESLKEAAMRYVTSVSGRDYVIEIIDEHTITLDGVGYRVDFETVSGQPVFSLLVDGKSYESVVYPGDDGWQVLLHGAQYLAVVEDERELRLRLASGGGIAEREEYHLRAPMPGLVVALPVSEGQPVEKGDVLLILESMKMQNELKSPRPGVVARLRVKAGDSVEQKQALLSVI
jgi:acetyl/propionyl-CoA carboxylase alpha subunit